MLAVEAVANEILGAAFETELSEPLILTVELSHTTTTVRVRCRRSIELCDEPFHLRERVLDGLGTRFGTHRHAEGSVELWADLARPDG